ncbi:hypothetical protein INR38_22365 [Delftia sp. SD018]|uniref:hypothetical protein n=1 Tax=unclassified Delftia TaxID=2613839 RepID=UPI001D4B3EAF|nr:MULTISPECIES: hypothetical protein [unclassified Delftia]MBO0991350.1 hypothetical protein [Delftia sp. SD083]MBO1036823.1 hypothetical protein [Delftia sp. SD018]
MLSSTPLYLDWTFWAALLSLVAIILSQLPPVHLILRPRRLEVEVHSRIRIAHLVGNPTAGIVISIRNTGGRSLRVDSIGLQLSRDRDPSFLLAGLNYFETPTSQTAVLFVPFTLRPGDTWSHAIFFGNDLDRQTEKLYRQSVSTLTADIQKKIAARAPSDNQPVVAAPELVEPFHELFRKLFIWQPGEYIAKLQVKAQPGFASFFKQYRFTLYESDTQELLSHTADYKIGGGICYPVASHAGLNVPLSEHVK